MAGSSDFNCYKPEPVPESLLILRHPNNKLHVLKCQYTCSVVSQSFRETCGTSREHVILNMLQFLIQNNPRCINRLSNGRPQSASFTSNVQTYRRPVECLDSLANHKWQSGHYISLTHINKMVSWFIDMYNYLQAKGDKRCGVMEKQLT